MERARLDNAIASASEEVISLQHNDGHWCGKFQAGVLYDSWYVMLKAVLGQLDDTKIADCREYILSQQAEDGGWSPYLGGHSNIKVSVDAYFALKLCGVDQDAEPMLRARASIMQQGGAGKALSLAKYMMAILGQLPYSQCPSVPPELLLLPRWSPLHIYKVSALSRLPLVALAVINAIKPRVRLEPRLGVQELFPDSQYVGSDGWSVHALTNPFAMLDPLIKAYESGNPSLIRQPAIRACEAWLLERVQEDEGLLCYQPMVALAMIAFWCLGYPEDSPIMKRLARMHDSLAENRQGKYGLQPCFSPVWDTAWTTIALVDAGVPADSPPIRKAAEWLLEREIRKPGDWCYATPALEPGGWAFGYKDTHYPDLDDTAMAVVALSHSGLVTQQRCQQAMLRGANVLRELQAADGGWASFDRALDSKFLNGMPFAEYQLMLDPSEIDITSRVLWMFGCLGVTQADPAIAKPLRWLTSNQQEEGCWYGRWGVNYIYGTWQTLIGLRAIGIHPHNHSIQQAVRWLKHCQHSQGGWGESCASYQGRSMMGKGKPTASQTAWGVMGLIAAGEAHSEAVERGVSYLIDIQKADGSWEDQYFTAVAIKDLCYMNYSFFSRYFPLMALARYRQAVAEEAAREESIRPTLADMLYA